MDVMGEIEINIQEQITERNNCLPPLLISLNSIDNSTKLLENIKLCAKYLRTYSILNVNQELLQHLVQTVKNNLLKVYDDNFLLSDTVQDEIVAKILKENLQISVGFIQFIKTSLEFLHQSNEIRLYNLNNTLIYLVQIISATFEHCKNSTDAYKQSFNVELLELFGVTQEIHLLFLKLFETCIVVRDVPTNIEEIETLTEVLDIICNMSEILSDLNIKSMTDNWKGYTAIINKFSSILACSINLKLPILCLSYAVNKNLSSIGTTGDVDTKLVTQVVKVTGFLVKVVLKICDIFWNNLVRASSEVLKFCCIVYSFPPDLYRSQGHLAEILILIENLIFKTIEPLLQRLLNDSQHSKMFSVDNLSVCKHPFGLLNFLGNILRVLVSNEIKILNVSVQGIINVIFNNVSLCFAEFFWESESVECIFDFLVLHISAAVIFYNECYGEVESILLKHLLQQHIFGALLAMEIWTLLLCNSTPQLCLSTLVILMEKYKEVNLGILTSRPERIYLQYFMQRLFKMLPDHSKNDFVLRYNPVRCLDWWRIIQFHTFPVQQRLSIEGICMSTIDKIEAIERGNFSFMDVTFIAENLAALSTVNWREIGLNPNNLAKAVLNLWVFNQNAYIEENNLVRYFVPELCKVTGSLVSEFSNRQLIMVLSQLKALSCDVSYKLQVCNLLSILSSKPRENHQDNFKVRTLITDIICQNLINDTSNVVRQETLEVVHSFAVNENHDVIENIVRFSKDMQNITNYLQRNAGNVGVNRFNKEYLESLGNISFQHECTRWRNEPDLSKYKKMKFDERCVEEIDHRKNELVLVEKKPLKSSKWHNLVEAPIINIDENKQDGNITDIIGNIKGEVKCLVNVLKTEKITAKNASDIRIIANQLLSLL